MSETNALIGIRVVHFLVGMIVFVVALLNWRDRGKKRIGTALFWFLFGFGFVFGDGMVALFGKATAHKLQGLIVLALALLAGTNQVGGGKPVSDLAEKRAHAARLGNRLFLPAIAIPVLTVALTLFGKQIGFAGLTLLDTHNLTLSGLVAACLLSLLLGWRLTGGSPVLAVAESRKIVDAMGWALILPLMLAMLGGVFVSAKTGESVQQLVAQVIDPDNRLLLILVYCLGMAGLTMVMGNAFAAFPIMAAGIALPFLLTRHNASPAPLMAIGMLSGYCGTLMTPMAANFNIIPAALLELKDPYQVIKVQIPTGLALLCCNVLLMYFVV